MGVVFLDVCVCLLRTVSTQTALFSTNQIAAAWGDGGGGSSGSTGCSVLLLLLLQLWFPDFVSRGRQLLILFKIGFSQA